MPTPRSRPALLAVLLVLLTAPGAGAQAPPEALALIRAHRERDITQRVEVTVRAAGESRSSTILVSTAPPNRLRAHFGPITAWTDNAALHAVHENDQRAVLRAPLEGEDPLRALSRHFPPLPVPHIALAFSGENALAELTPYTRRMTWSAADPRDPEGPAVQLRGRGDRSEADLWAGDDGLIQRLVIHLDRASAHGGVEIDIACTPAEHADFPAIDPPLARRFTIEATAAFVPRGALVLPGDPFPKDLPLIALDDTFAPPDISGPAAVLFFRTWNTEAASALAAVRAFAEEWPRFARFPAIVLSPVATNIRLQLGGLDTILLPDTLSYTTRSEFTLARFTDNDSALIVLDDDSTVRAVIPLDTTLNRDPAARALFDIDAEPDPDLTAELTTAIRRAVNPTAPPAATPTRIPPGD